MVIAGVAAVLPYVQLLGVLPVGKDIYLWGTQLDIGDKDWFENVFLKPHYIAYRPVAALSFTLNSLFPGSMPRGLRGTDIALHVGVGFALYGAWLALCDRPRSGWGVAAAALFWTSPLSEWVVPFITRRSYTLSALFGLIALTLTLNGVRRNALSTTLAGAGCLLLSMLSNETGFVLAPVLVLVAALWSSDWRRVGVHAAPAVVAAVAAAAARSVVLGGLGGYEDTAVMVAVVENGERSMFHDPSPGLMFAYAWRGAVVPDTLAGESPFLFAAGGTRWIALAGTLWAVGWSGFRAVRRRDPVPALLLVWATGYAILTVLGHVWFPRMSYAMGAPVVLWLVWATRESITGCARWNLVPLALVLAARAQHATALTPLPRDGLEDQFAGSTAARHAVRTLAPVVGPAVVWMGTPGAHDAGFSMVGLVQKLRGGGVDMRHLAFVQGAPEAGPSVTFEPTGVRLVKGARWGDALRSQPGGAERPFSALQVDSLPTWILDDGVLTPLPVTAP